jgi:hypothetical protein
MARGVQDLIELSALDPVDPSEARFIKRFAR